MTTRELYEMASLDALGLLDDEEREQFERAFKSAPPHVQSQIRREQTRFADAEKWLPKVEPPPGLRARVLSAVRDAITAVRTQPIASIGPASPMASTATFWRAACIGFATATVVLAGFVYSVAEKNKQITSDALYNAFADQVKGVGGAQFIDLITESTTQAVSFLPAAPDFYEGAEAKLFVDSATKEAFLVCEGLPISTSGEYTLVIKPKNSSKPSRVEPFRATGDAIGIPLHSMLINGSERLEIHAPRRVNGETDLIMVGGEV